VSQLEYKADWYGRTLVKIDRWYPSSKRCSNCGHLLNSLTLDVREWTCPECGASHDRDINAANNLLMAGQAISACGTAIRPGAVKTKPGCREEAGSPRSDPRNPLPITAWGACQVMNDVAHLKL
jgi:putative transposase